MLKLIPFAALFLFACGAGLPEAPVLPAPPAAPAELGFAPVPASVGLEGQSLDALCRDRCPSGAECFASFNGVSCGECLPGFRAEDEECVFDAELVGAHVGVGFGPPRVDAFAERDMVRVNEEPFPKQIGSPSLKSVWISDRTMFLPDGTLASVAEVYARAHFSSSDETPIAAPLPVGTLLIHQTVGGAPFNGVMVKREPDFDDEGNDWWYGKFDYNGNPVPLEGWGGSLTCTDCHMPESEEHPHDLVPLDLLFGVPRDQVFVDE